MAYTKDDNERNCLHIIEEEFIKRYPITARRHDLIQLKQQRGQLLTTFINNLLMLGSEADMWELKPEDWMANLAIAGVVDQQGSQKGIHENRESEHDKKFERWQARTRKKPTAPNCAQTSQKHSR